MPNCLSPECWRECSQAAKNNQPGRCHGLPGVTNRRLVTAEPTTSLPPKFWTSPEESNGKIVGELVKCPDGFASFHPIVPKK